MRHIVTALLLTRAFAAGAICKDATVIVLTPEGAQSAKVAYSELAAVQQEFDVLKDILVHKDRAKDEHFAYGEFWRFSTDYMAMVPCWTASEATAPCMGWPQPRLGTATPAIQNGTSPRAVFPEVLQNHAK